LGASRVDEVRSTTSPISRRADLGISPNPVIHPTSVHSASGSKLRRLGARSDGSSWVRFFPAGELYGLALQLAMLAVALSGALTFAAVARRATRQAPRQHSVLFVPSIAP